MGYLSPISSPESFWEAARWQRACAICGRAHGQPDWRGRTWHAHHVIPKRLLKRLKLLLYDTRNALRVCTDCHYAEEWSPRFEMKVAHLKDENICYCWEVLGVAVVQLERRYGEFDLDPRWARHRMGECELCQRQPT